MTDADRWLRIDALFDAALDLPASERGALLDRECASDLELRQAVERLLGHAESEKGLGTAGALDWFDVLDTGASAELPSALEPGSRVGAWQVGREIGRGGMAVVFEAERVEGGYQQRAALKVARSGGDQEQLVAGFARERQILASLQHPDIARLLDGGTTDDGLPYFVMELVDGQSIHRYCDDRRLTVAQRLRLFATVGRAVQAAHGSLVVHRDIKPSNIMVTTSGQVKLLDFGIAEAFDSRAVEGLAEEARPGLSEHLPERLPERRMTPEYASPEQVRGEAVTTASDVYQLGVLLFELLSGRRPHSFSRPTPKELVRAICEQEALPPSTAISTDRSAADLEATSRARGTRPAALRRTLRGDLDHIVMRAMHKVPSQRYGSVAQMVDDIERYLDGHAVVARQGGVLYRLGKLVRRHAGGFAVAALSIAALAALIIVYTWRLADERDRAHRLANFLSGVLEVTNPWSAGSGELTAHQLLDHGAQRIETDLAADPETEVVVRSLFGKAYARLGAVERAQKQHELALGHQRRLLGPEHPEVAAIELELGRLVLGRSQFDAARQLLEHAAAVQRRELSEQAPILGQTLTALGELERNYLRFDLAFELGSEALAILEAANTPESLELVRPLELLATLHDNRGEHQAAAQLRRRVLQLRQTYQGADSPELADALGRLARTLMLGGEMAAAEPLFERSLKLFDAAFVGEQPWKMGETLAAYALLLHREGKHSEAVEQQRRAMQIAERIFGSLGPATMTRVHDLGLYLIAADRSAEAVPYLARSLAALERAFGQDSQHLLEPMVALAFAAVDSGDPSRARGLAARAAVLLGQLETLNSAATTSARILAEVYDKLNDQQAAADLRQWTASIGASSAGPPSSD